MNKEYSFFFIRGHARSGTNWVCNLLNLHPEVACAGEFHFAVIKRSLEMRKLTRHSLLSKECAGNIMTSYFERGVQACMLDAASKLQKPEARLIGDRTPEGVEHLPLPGRPCIFTLRDGRDVLISKAYYDMRNCKLKKLNFEAYPVMKAMSACFIRDPMYFIKNPEKLLSDEQWVRKNAHAWASFIRGSTEFIDKNGKGNRGAFYICRYESMHRDTENERRKLYEFLKLDPDRALPLGDLTKAGFPKENPMGFFRKGESGDWKNYFTKTTAAWFAEETGSLLGDLNYAV